MTNKELERKVDNLTDRFEALISSLTYGGKSISKLLPHKESPIVEKQQPKEEFEVGDWITQDESLFICCITSIETTTDEDGVFNCYGLSGCGEWKDDHDFIFNSEERKATPQEIETALIKEAKKRGFKEGVRFICLSDVSSEEIFIDQIKTNEAGDLICHTKESCSGWGFLFIDGKWATIIEDSFKFKGYKVEVITNVCTHLDTKEVTESKHIVIGCASTGWRVNIDVIQELHDTLVDLSLISVEHQEVGDITLIELRELIDYINK